MARSKHVSDADLVAYEDNDPADAARVARIAAHLVACPACRQRLADFAEVGRLLRERYPLKDDPAARAAILARIAEERERRAREAGSADAPD